MDFAHSPLRIKYHIEIHNWIILTLRADQYERYFGGVTVVCHFRVIPVHGVETRLVLQTEDEYDRVHPGGKL